jgi:hypothetical protein
VDVNRRPTHGWSRRPPRSRGAFFWGSAFPGWYGARRKRAALISLDSLRPGGTQTPRIRAGLDGGTEGRGARLMPWLSPCPRRLPTRTGGARSASCRWRGSSKPEVRIRQRVGGFTQSSRHSVREGRDNSRSLSHRKPEGPCASVALPEREHKDPHIRVCRHCHPTHRASSVGEPDPVVKRQALLQHRGDLRA